MKWLFNHDLLSRPVPNIGESMEDAKKRSASYVEGKVIGEPQSHGDMLPVGQLKKMGLVGVYEPETT